MTNTRVPDGLLWDHPDHVAAKHAILRRCLEAWFPIAGKFHEVTFVDGFAGPDQYEGGEPGSPLLALDVGEEHARSLAKSDIRFVFIEEDYALADRLQRALDARKLPANFEIDIHPGTFEQSMTRVLDSFGDSGMPPTFVMLDPFGGAGVPFEVMKQLAQQLSCDLLVMCMPETIERWGETNEVAGGHVDRMFRGSAWRGLSREAQVALYQDNLHSAGFSHARSFQMTHQRTRNVYYLIGATHDAAGVEVMERAFGEAGESGDYVTTPS